MLEKSIKDLNLDDRMYLAIHEYKLIIFCFTALVAFSGVLIFYTILISLETADFTPTEIISMMFTALICTTIVMAVFCTLLIIKSSRFFKELSNMQQQKIRQSYFLAIETTVPEGETSVERVYDILENVLPEIKLAKKNALKKGKKFQNDLKFKTKGEVFDLKVDTSQGILLVEFFDKTLSWDDLEGFVKRIKNALNDDIIFRIVCVSKDLDDIFLSEELSDKIKKLGKPYKIDLLKEDKTGFTTYFIG